MLLVWSKSTKGKEHCPAYGKTCKLCKKDNYFSRCCKTKNNVNACGVNEDVFVHSEGDYILHVDDYIPNSVHAKMCINGKMIFNGASTNYMSERVYRTVTRDRQLTGLKYTDKSLRMYNGN